MSKSRTATKSPAAEALELLAECLNDAEPWGHGQLVERMEEVFFTLGGKQLRYGRVSARGVTPKYELKSLQIETFKSGPRQGQRKPFKLPADAIPCGVVSGFGLSLDYLIPVPDTRPEDSDA